MIYTPSAHWKATGQLQIKKRKNIFFIAPSHLALTKKLSVHKKTSENVPKYIRSLSLEDYFSEQVTGKYAIQTIQNNRLYRFGSKRSCRVSSRYVAYLARSRKR